MKGGSIFRGTISEYNLSDMLTMTTWSGAKMQIPSNAVRRVVQDCKGGVKVRGEKVYNFKERGWYHCSRVAMLFGDVQNGYSLQHSSGYQLNRFLGVGAGIGLENYGPGDIEPVIAPLYIETRAYLTRQRIAPFLSLGAGYSAIAKEQRNIDWWGGENNLENWHGGWLAQGQAGYRIGNHFITFIGIRLQHLKVDWDNNVWGGGKGTDVYLKKRIEFGVGLLI
jgi:opacity protein-like surface antigen